MSEVLVGFRWFSGILLGFSGNHFQLHSAIIQCSAVLKNNLGSLK